jgi:ribosomal-protein-alanine N-acetyltransferase
MEIMARVPSAALEITAPFAVWRRGCQVRMANEADIPVLAELEQACFSQPRSANALKDEMAASVNTFWVAEQNNAVVGYISMQIVPDEAFVLNIAVSPEHRRKGIANALLSYAETRCFLVGCNKIHLEVRESNQAALSLYRSRLYLEVGRRPGFYAQPKEDAVLLTLGCSDYDNA